MKSSHEISVNRRAFADAIAYPFGKWPTRWRRRYFTGETVLTYGTDGLDAELPVHCISEVNLPPIRDPANGTWTTFVGVDGQLLAGLAGKLGRAKSVALVYVDGRLAIGNLTHSGTRKLLGRRPMKAQYRPWGTLRNF